MREISDSLPICFYENPKGESASRRTKPRFQTIMRVGRITLDDDQGLARVKNVSDNGAHLHVSIPLRLRVAVTLELAEGEALLGQVVWVADDECGIRFDQQIDCAALLRRLAQSTLNGVTRSLRLQTSKPAVIRSERGVRLAKVQDISQRGMKLLHDGSLTENMAVKITLPSGLERCGIVRWSRDNIAGVLLLQPFCTEELGWSRAL
ncbi:MAG: PilZ domain-containing protein [Pseudomonadota bacterium]